MTGMTPEKATALRRPFPPESVGQLPKGGALLDFVGHAAVTDRLLTVDPYWTWEPFALDAEGLPAPDAQGNLWIRLTVCGVTRIGVGDGKNAKERIGDALRNAAMRFGVALDLWAKENLVEFAQAAQGTPSRTLTDNSDVTHVYDDDGILGSLETAVAGPMEARTRARLFALFGEHHITDPDEQRAGISHIIGRTIASRSELTEDEAQAVIKVLAARTKPAALEATS